MSIPGAIVDSAPVAAGTFAPADAEYLVLALNAVLTDERLFTPGVGLSAVDGGPGGLYTLNVNADAGLWDLTVAVVHLDVGTNTVAVGSTVMAGAEKMRVLGATNDSGFLTTVDGSGATFVFGNQVSGAHVGTGQYIGGFYSGSLTQTGGGFAGSITRSTISLGHTGVGWIWSAYHDNTQVTGAAGSGNYMGFRFDVGKTGAATLTDMTAFLACPSGGGGAITRYYGIFTEPFALPTSEVGGHFTGATTALEVGAGTPAVPTVAGRWFEDGDMVLGAAAMAGAEVLRVVGAARIEGKLTVTGAIDPPSVLLSGGTALFFESNDGVTAPVSGAATGRLRYNNTGTGNWQVSVQGGAYANLVTGTGPESPWTTTAGIIHPDTLTEPVAIGVTTVVGAEMLRVNSPGSSHVVVIQGDRSPGQVQALRLENDTVTSGATNAVSIDFFMPNSTPTAFGYGTLQVSSADPTATVEKGKFELIVAEPASNVVYEYDATVSTHLWQTAGSPRASIVGAVGATTGRFELNDGVTAVVSAAGSGALRYNNTSSTFQVSISGAAYVDILTAAVGSAAFLQGGNSFGATAVLGTNDANDIEIETGGTTVATINQGGDWVFEQIGVASGTPNFMVFAASSHTGLAAGVEAIDIDFDLNRNVQFATGAIVTQRAYVIQAPTYAFVGASTITTAATFAIGGAPAAGANATLTDSFALWVQSGTSQFDGPVVIDAKLTVTGAIDPTSVLLSGGTALFYESNDGSTAPVSGAATGRLRYNNAGTGNWQVSTQGGAYVDLVTGTGPESPWTTTLTVIHQDTLTNPVGIGTSTMTFGGTQKFELNTTSVGNTFSTGMMINSTNDTLARTIWQVRSGTNDVVLQATCDAFTPTGTLVANAGYVIGQGTGGGLHIVNTSGFITWRPNDTERLRILGVVPFGGTLLHGTTTNNAWLYSVQPGATSPGSARTTFRIDVGAHVGGATPASTELPAVNFDMSATVEFDTGALALQRAFLIQAPTYAFLAASTITTAATVAINGAPIAGVNATITDSFALDVTGATRITGKLTVTGAIDPTSVSLSTGTALFFESDDGSTAPVSAAAGGRLRYNNAGSGNWQVSVQGGAYVNIATGVIAGNTLDQAYDEGGAGAGRTITANDGAVEVAGTDGLEITQAANTSGNPVAFLITGGAHTTLTAADTPDIDFNLSRTVQFTAGGDFDQQAVIFRPPTYAATAAQTLLSATTVVIQGAPAAGANVTIDTPRSFYVISGEARFDGTLINSLGDDLSFAFTNGGNGFGAAATVGSSDDTLSFQANGTNFALINNGGDWAVVQENQGAGTQNFLVYTSAALTSQTASTESIIADFDFSATMTFATGALALQRAFVVQAPTYAFDAASTLTTAATVAITGAPIAGANATITNAFALDVTGATRITGKLTVTGAIDPLSVLLSGSTALFYESNDGSTAPVSGAATGRIRYNNAGSGTWQVSTQAGAYVDIATGAGGGTLDDAYDFGGAGAGRTITASAGAVEIDSTAGAGLALKVQRDVVAGASQPLAISNESAASFSNTVEMGFFLNATAGLTEYARLEVGSLDAGATPDTAFNIRLQDDGSISLFYQIETQTIGHRWFKPGGGEGMRLNPDGNLLVNTSTGSAFIYFVEGAVTSGNPHGFRFDSAAHTGITASTEAVSANFDLSATIQFATGALATQRAFVVQAPTYAFVAASTLTSAATVAIDGAPIAGTNATLTNTFAFWVQSGLSEFDGDVEINRELFFDEDTQALVGNQNNLALGNKVVHRLTADTNINITGLVAPTIRNRIITIINVDTTDRIVLVEESASSTAGNRIITNIGNLTLAPGDSATLWYDQTTARWRVIS